MTYRLALDISSSKSTLALVAATEPEILAHERLNTADLLTASNGPDGASATPPELIAQALRGFMDTRRVHAAELLGVGIGIPGVVDRDTGQVIYCPNVSALNGTDLGASLSDELHLPVYIENDSNLIALGEHEAGSSRGIDEMALISVGAGLGCGLILGGQLYHGADGAAGEFGHTILVPDGLTCSCGAHGCLEMYCSERALALAAEELFGEEAVERAMRGSNGLSSGGAQFLIEQARAGHEQAQAALTHAFRNLGQGISSLVNLLNPRLIVLEGDLVLAWPECLETVRETVSAQALSSARANLSLEVSQLAPYGAVLGGAALVTRALKIS